MSYYLRAALARERQRTLLAEAEAFRRAKQARTRPPTARDTTAAKERRGPWWQLTRRAVPSTETPG